MHTDKGVLKPSGCRDKAITLSTAGKGFQFPQPAAVDRLQVNAGLVDNFIQRVGFTDGAGDGVNGRGQDDKTRFPAGAIKIRQADVPVTDAVGPAGRKVNMVLFRG